ncbi:MAG: iron-containing redox enzyme family protein [Myxococcales bacterium]|nr:iron-containing redox enzyme family protein [Myxococcales bacterium]
MDRDAFREALLGVMERKTHWAWPAFTRGEVPADRLHLHLEQEYGTYVREFAVLLGRAYVQCPVAEVRRDLAENLYEEETGRLSRGRPHAELFLEYPRGLGMDLERFERVELQPAAARYRAALDEATMERGWELATAVTTIFVEGTRYERGELDPNAPRRPEPPLSSHPLVVHYGLPLASLELTKVHRQVEGDHRAAAWRMVLDHVPEPRRVAVAEGMEEVLRRWSDYRDEVAESCGIRRTSDGSGGASAG